MQRHFSIQTKEFKLSVDISTIDMKVMPQVCKIFRDLSCEMKFRQILFKFVLQIHFKIHTNRFKHKKHLKLLGDVPTFDMKVMPHVCKICNPVYPVR